MLAGLSVPWLNSLLVFWNPFAAGCGYLFNGQKVTEGGASVFPDHMDTSLLFRCQGTALYSSWCIKKMIPLVALLATVQLFIKGVLANRTMWVHAKILPQPTKTVVI